MKVSQHMLNSSSLGPYKNKDIPNGSRREGTCNLEESNVTERYVKEKNISIAVDHRNRKHDPFCEGYANTVAYSDY